MINNLPMQFPLRFLFSSFFDALIDIAPEFMPSSVCNPIVSLFELPCGLTLCMVVMESVFSSFFYEGSVIYTLLAKVV